jgi:hypothetical protein
MTKGYRFDDFEPKPGSTVHAFRSLKALKNFSQMQGAAGRLKFWEIDGMLIRDEGGEDGLVMKVISAKQVRL